LFYLIHPSNAAGKLRNAPSSAGGDQHGGGAVVYRKGELSKGTIESRVAVPARDAGERVHRELVAIRRFCEGPSLCPRGHSFRRDDTDMIVFCFADRAMPSNSRPT
jgi:hypothetical protein